MEEKKRATQQTRLNNPLGTEERNRSTRGELKVAALSAVN